MNLNKFRKLSHANQHGLNACRMSLDVVHTHRQVYPRGPPTVDHEVSVQVASLSAICRRSRESLLLARRCTVAVNLFLCSDGRSCPPTKRMYWKARCMPFPVMTRPAEAEAEGDAQRYTKKHAPRNIKRRQHNLKNEASLFSVRDLINGEVALHGPKEGREHRRQENTRMLVWWCFLPVPLEVRCALLSAASSRWRRRLFQSLGWCCSLRPLLSAAHPTFLFFQKMKHSQQFFELLMRRPAKHVSGISATMKSRLTRVFHAQAHQVHQIFSDTRGVVREKWRGGLHQCWA